MRPLIALWSPYVRIFVARAPRWRTKNATFFFVRHTGARATILRMESEAYPPSARIRFFVRFLCALRAPWRLNGEWNTNNFLYLRNTVVFCSPGRPIWRTKYECGALSPRSCFLFATEAPWRTKYEWFPNNSIFDIFLFAKQVPGRPFYEWNPKHIHLRHTFGFLFVFCAH